MAHHGRWPRACPVDGPSLSDMDQGYMVYGCAWQSCVCSVESTRQARVYGCAWQSCVCLASSLEELGRLLNEPTQIQGRQRRRRLARVEEGLVDYELKGEQLHEILMHRRFDQHVDHGRRNVRAIGITSPKHGAPMTAACALMAMVSLPMRQVRPVARATAATTTTRACAATTRCTVTLARGTTPCRRTSRGQRTLGRTGDMR